jgi:uncharacterized protein (UPF0371 family)
MVIPSSDRIRHGHAKPGAILERIERFDNKLYLEFGEKLLFDHHASRVLPRFDPNVKMRLLSKLRDTAEIIICIYAGDIERKKMRADFGISYDADTFKLIDDRRFPEVMIDRSHGHDAWVGILPGD